MYRSSPQKGNCSDRSWNESNVLSISVSIPAQLQYVYSSISLQIILASINDAPGEQVISQKISSSYLESHLPVPIGRGGRGEGVFLCKNNVPLMARSYFYDWV